jgi:hypothetical protein
MIIRTKRIEGFGKGTTIGFPTINVYLPIGTIELGMWAIATKLGKSFGLFSEHNGQIRGEIHVLSKNVKVEVDDSIDLVFVKKLRDPFRIKDIQKDIQDDNDLAYNFWKGYTDCESCERHYQQDYGYSNYTVEGTNYGCYANVWEEDNDYGFDLLKYISNNCKYYKKGDFWQLDVDGNNKPPDESWFTELNRDLKLTDLLGND